MTTPLPNNHLAVKVPEYATDPWVINNGQEKVGINYYNPSKSFGEEGNMWSEGQSLPQGQYSILCLLSKVTEEIARGVVPKYDGDFAWIPSYNDPDSGGHGYCYPDYTSEDEHAIYYTALESFQSLKQSLGLVGEYIVLKKEV